MGHKVTVVLLVLLLVISGGLGYYSHLLNQQVNAVQEQVLTQQQEQTKYMNTVSNELTAFRGEANTRLDLLSDEIGRTGFSITALEGVVGDSQARIDSLQGEVTQFQTGFQSDLSDLETRVEQATDISTWVINAREVFAQVHNATVRISNGDRTLGSGFLYDSEGHVATAYHVIENLSRIYVIFPDGRISAVTDTASSPESDVAILTIASKPELAPLLVGDSDETQIGAPVVAIGSPFDLAETITSGVISQKDRFTEISSDTTSRWIANLIQFDAPANPGNSGCPLFNARGEVIGLVIARILPNEGDGIYYAVSANKLKKVAASLIATGSFAYPWIGVNVSDLTPQLVQKRGLDSIYGVLVQSIFVDSPAVASGIINGDIITEIDGSVVRNIADLTSYLGEHKITGEETVLQISRADSKFELSLTVGKRPS
ncbi:S1C family serine protease [Chloroflexota bacterium]